MKKLKIIIIAFILIAVICSTSFVVMNKNNEKQNVKATISQLTICNKEEIEEFCKDNSVSKKLKNALSNADDYVIARADFSVIAYEKVIIKRAYLDSEVMKVIYNNKNYNISESPINLDKDDVCNFFIYFLIPKEDLSSIENTNIEEYIRSNIKIEL